MVPITSSSGVVSYRQLNDCFLSIDKKVAGQPGTAGTKASEIYFVKSGNNVIGQVKFADGAITDPTSFPQFTPSNVEMLPDTNVSPKPAGQ